MRWTRSSIAVFVLCVPAVAQAKVRYADNQLVSNCTSGNYSIASRNCSGTDGDAYKTIAFAISPTQAGDTVFIRAGTTWNEQINLQDGNKTGTQNAWITIAGAPGEVPLFQYVSAAEGGYGTTRARGNRGSFFSKT